MKENLVFFFLPLLFSRTNCFLASLIALSAFFFVACEKDKDETIDVNFLYGVWTVDNVDLDGTVNGISPEQFIEAETGITGPVAQIMIDETLNELEDELDLPDAINFKSDGTYEVTSTGGSETGNWTLVDNLLTINPGESEEMEITIVSLSEKELIATMEETVKTDITEDGVDETFVLDIELTFVK